MEFAPKVQIRQCNDWDVLAFLNDHSIKYSLTGDHLFVIHGHQRDMSAGPGDWLCLRPDGDVEVEPGVFTLHAQRAIQVAHHVA